MKKTSIKRISLAPETVKTLSLPTGLVTVQGAARARAITLDPTCGPICKA